MWEKIGIFLGVLIGFLSLNLVSFAEPPNEESRKISLYEEGEIRPGHGKYLTGEGGWVSPLAFQDKGDGSSLWDLQRDPEGDPYFCAIDPSEVPGLVYVVQIEEDTLIVQFLSIRTPGGSLCPNGIYFKMTKVEFLTMVFGT